MLEASGKYWLGNKPSRWFRNLSVWWGNPTRRLEASPRNPGPSALLRPGQHPAAVRAAPGSRSPPEPAGKRGGALGRRAPAPARRGRRRRAPPRALFPGRSRPEAVEGAARPRKSQVRRAGIRVRGHLRSAAVSGPGGWPGRQGPGWPSADAGAGHPRFPVGGTRDPRRAARGPGRVGHRAPRPRRCRHPARAVPGRSGGRPERDGGAAGVRPALGVRVSAGRGGAQRPPAAQRGSALRAAAFPEARGGWLRCPEGPPSRRPLRLPRPLPPPSLGAAVAGLRWKLSRVHRYVCAHGLPQGPSFQGWDFPPGLRSGTGSGLGSAQDSRSPHPEPGLCPRGGRHALSASVNENLCLELRCQAGNFFPVWRGKIWEKREKLFRV